MITNFKIFENESDNQYVEIHRELNKIFTGFRENISYLKNIWFKFDYTDEKFVFDVIWFYSYKTTKLIDPPNESHKVIYHIRKSRNFSDTLIIDDYLSGESQTYIDTKNFIETVKNFCLNLDNYLDYKYYRNLKRIMNNDLIILDYDKFLKEFEEELEESKSLELYNLIDNFYIILSYADTFKRREIEKYLKDKYSYILNANKYNM